MTKLDISLTRAGRVAAAAIAAITLTAVSCQADELGPSCKQYLQLKMQCLGAKANTIESNGNAEKAREIRRSIPFEMHRAIHLLAKNLGFMDASRVEQYCAEDAWYIQNAESPKNYRPETSVRLCSVTTSWPENYKITPDSDSKVEARIREIEAEIGISRWLWASSSLRHPLFDVFLAVISHFNLSAINGQVRASRSLTFDLHRATARSPDVTRRRSDTTR